MKRLFPWVLVTLIALAGVFGVKTVLAAKHTRERAEKRAAGYREVNIGGVSLQQSRGEAEARVGVPNPGSRSERPSYTTPQGLVEINFANNDIVHEVWGEMAELKGTSVRKGDSRARIREVFGAPSRESPNADHFSAPYWVFICSYDAQGLAGRFTLERQINPADDGEAAEREAQMRALDAENQRRIREKRGY